MLTSRRNFLLGAGTALGAMDFSSRRAIAANAAPRMTPHRALTSLMEGNDRFATDKPSCLATTALRAELANGQAPFAMVLGCSDSRVPVETIFDHEPGDIFVVRVAGNFVTPEGIGTLEYGFSVLKASLLMVLGHTSCGAVKASLEFLKTGKRLPGHMQRLVDAIAPGIKGATAEHEAIVLNVRANVEHLRSSVPLLAAGLREGGLAIVGAVYDLHTGRVAEV